MAMQRLTSFGAFFFVAGASLIAIALAVTAAATVGEIKQQLVAAGVIVGFSVGGGLCFIAAALCTRPPEESAGKDAPATASRPARLPADWDAPAPRPDGGR